jgi:oligopeptide transport system substrate-binding protein
MLRTKYRRPAAPNRRPGVRRAGAIALVSLALGACNGGGGAVPKVGLASNQVLSFPIPGDFESLDPATLDKVSEAEIAHNLFNGLVRFDSNLNIVPDVAASMPVRSADGLTYTFALRKDVTFSNGDKVTSKDVLYSWNRAAAMQGAYASNLSAIAGYDKVSTNQTAGATLEALLEKRDPTVTMSGLTAPNDYTVVVKLASAAGWFLSALAQPASTGCIVDEKVVRVDLDKWWTRPQTLAGTGAFKMTAHTINQSADFVAVPNWWGKPTPTLTDVHVDIVTSSDAAVAKYEQRAYDIFGYGGYSDAPVTDVIRIESTAEKAQLLLQPKNATDWVSFNLVTDPKRTAGGPFTLAQGKTAHDLRKAFALAVDRAKLAHDVCQGIVCIPATGGLITKGLLGYMGDGNDPLAAYDPNQARRLLLAADPTGSKTKGLVYTYNPDNPLNVATATFLASQWLDNLGVSVQVQPVPRAQFIDARLRGSYALSRDGWQAQYDHPQEWFDNLWGRFAGCPDVTCTSGYDTRAYDNLVAKADSEPLAIAIPDYQALSRLLIADAAYIPLYYSVGVFLIHPWVKGAGSNNLFDYYWNQIQIESH